MTDTADVVITSDPAPGPGARVSRSTGQLGGALVFIELWQAFGWFGADTWTAEEAAQRWPAITATALFVIAVAHNAWNWWSARAAVSELPGAVTVAAVAGRSATPAPKRQREHGLTTIGLVILILFVILVFAALGLL